MYLETLQTTLRQELYAAHTQRHFERIQPKHRTIPSHTTVGALLAILEARAPDAQPARQELVRALVVLTQEAPAEPLWKQLLLYTFLPGLYSIRMRTSSRAHPPDDLDGELCAVFLDVVACYPLHRTGSIAAGILYDTRKRYHRRLRRQQREVEQLDEMVQSTRGLSDEQRRAWCFNRFSPSALSGQDRAEMLAALVRCDTISAEDAQLLWCTDVCGMTIPQFLKERKNYNRHGDLPQRACARVWRRRLRARQRVAIFFKKMTGGVSSFGPYPASYIVRGQNGKETKMTDSWNDLLRCAMRQFVVRFSRLIIIQALGDEVVWGITRIVDDVLDEYLAPLSRTETAPGGTPGPHPAIARLLDRLDRHDTTA